MFAPPQSLVAQDVFQPNAEDPLGLTSSVPQWWEEAIASAKREAQHYMQMEYVQGQASLSPDLAFGISILWIDLGPAEISKRPLRGIFPYSRTNSRKRRRESEGVLLPFMDVGKEHARTCPNNEV